MTLAGPPEIVAVVSPEMLRLALLGKVVTAGDDVSLLPQDVMPDAANRALVEAARRSLANRVGYAWTSTLLTVVDGRARPTRRWSPWTRWSAGRTGTSHAHAAPPATPRSGRRRRPPPTRRCRRPSIDDLPGLRAQAQELTELLDLGFHHREVLGRLGTTVSLGVLVTGPAGSGKSALVRAVAAAVGRPGRAGLGAGAGRADQRRRGRAGCARLAREVRDAPARRCC